jgi:hypothetical protein
MRRFFSACVQRRFLFFSFFLSRPFAFVYPLPASLFCLFLCDAFCCCKHISIRCIEAHVLTGCYDEHVLYIELMTWSIQINLGIISRKADREEERMPPFDIRATRNQRAIRQTSTSASATSAALALPSSASSTSMLSSISASSSSSSSASSSSS